MRKKMSLRVNSQTGAIPATLTGVFSSLDGNYSMLEVLSKLNPDALSSMSLTCKRFRVITNLTDLWQIILKRDFGICRFCL